MLVGLVYYNTYDELKNNTPEADAYIVDSDQVWNPKCLNPNLAKGSKLNECFLFQFWKKKILYVWAMLQVGELRICRKTGVKL